MKRLSTLLTIVAITVISFAGHAQTALRPVSHVTYSRGMLSDSTLFSYSAGRGGAVRFAGNSYERNISAEIYTIEKFWSGYINYDIMDQFRPNTFYSRRRYINAYNTHSDVVSRLAQIGDNSNVNNLTLHSVSGIGTPVVTDQYSNWDTATASWLPASHSITTYHSASLSDVVYQEYSGSGWINAQRNVYTYTSQNKLQTNTLAYWQSSGAAWRDTFKVEYYYSAAGDLDLLVRSGKTGFGWGSTTTRYYYDNLHDAIKMEQISGNLVTLRDSNVYDAQHNRIFVYEEQSTYPPTLLKPYSRTTITYTGSQVQTIGYESLDSLANPFNSYFERYEYESYQPTDVASVPSTGSFEVYPVPAKDFIHIEGYFPKAADVHCSIRDITGHTVQQWNVPQAGHFRTTIPVQNIAPGHYMLELTSAEQHFTKHIVVAQ